jgi:UDP-N-acetylglucosamine acyltransferase
VDLKQDLYNTEWINIDGNHIHKTAIIFPNVQMGKGNWVGAYSVIGSNGEIRGKNPLEFKGSVIIGNNNIISELVTIQRPFEEKKTVIGSDNIIMAHSHIGHDVYIGDGCEICTGTIIGGFTTIKDNVKLKLGVTVRNRIEIGVGATIGQGSNVTKDVYGNAVVYGNPAKQKT